MVLKDKPWLESNVVSVNGINYLYCAVTSVAVHQEKNIKVCSDDVMKTSMVKMYPVL